MIVDIPRKRRFPYRKPPVAITVNAIDECAVRAAVVRELENYVRRVESIPAFVTTTKG